jgi:two-component system phosphate regulon response regulator OmpR
VSTARTLLVVDDDARLRELLAEYLSGRGYAVLTAEDGERGLERVKSGGVDLVILDVMLPGMDGFDVMKALRRFSAVPVVMLTARGDELDRIIGLEIGADDYLPKPFNPRELLARIQAVLRRHGARPEDESTRAAAGPLVVDGDRRLATLAGEPLDLTTTEFDILRTLVTNAGRVIPRERLMELARGEDYAAFERSVDVHVSHIRRKLGDDSKRPRFLKTVRGIGYTIPKDPG